MRFVDCAQSWHSFDDLYHHLLLMMDFDCPLTFCHKKEEYIFEHLVLFSKGEHFFRLIQSVFQSIEIAFNIFCEPLSVSIN